MIANADIDERCILTVCLPDAGAAQQRPLLQARSAAEALAILRLSRVDLLLTGLDVPDMSPWQLVRRIRASACPPRWALVASAGLSTADEIQARSLGAIAVLEQMPAGDALDALLARVRPAVARRRTPAKSPSFAAAGVGTDSSL